MLQPFSCSNCGGPVASRRPSESGLHFCSKKLCQAAKQSTYRRLRAEKQRAADERNFLESADIVDATKMRLVHAALHQPRRKCESCGLENAISGFIHRSSPGSGAICEGTGGQGQEVGPKWINLMHPELMGDGEKLW